MLYTYMYISGSSAHQGWTLFFLNLKYKIIPIITPITMGTVIPRANPNPIPRPIAEPCSTTGEVSKIVAMSRVHVV